MVLADLALARRLEAAEGAACAEFAVARQRLLPACDSAWTRCAGATLVFDGVDAPTTQTFGLGLFGEITPDVLDEVEEFFARRDAASVHEICPLVGADALHLLCERGYRPTEISNVMYRLVESHAPKPPDKVKARAIDASDAKLWCDVSTRGWAYEHPELEGFMREMSALCVARTSSRCFLAELDGSAGAAGILSMHDGVALFGGSSTVPELRRRGLQGALLDVRMRHAAEAGCDLAMMVAEAGSTSQKNAERKGFRVGYTRMKWRRAPAL